MSRLKGIAVPVSPRAYGERGCIVLSLAPKTVLAWLVFFGAMQSS